MRMKSSEELHGRFLPLQQIWTNASYYVPLGYRLVYGHDYTQDAITFPYFWSVAETCNSMFPLCLRLAETWKLKSTWFRHISGTEMPSHVSVIFKPADFRRFSFPSCFCKRICSCLVHLPKHKGKIVLWTTMNLNILTSRRRTTSAAAGSTSPHTS